MVRLDCKLIEIVKLSGGDKLLVYTLPEDVYEDCSAQGCDDLAEFAEVLVELRNVNVCFNCKECLNKLKSHRDTPVRIKPLSIS